MTVQNIRDEQECGKGMESRAPICQDGLEVSVMQACYSRAMLFNVPSSFSESKS